jgi:hypothetical protein
MPSGSEISTTGLRTDYFDFVSVTASNPALKKYLVEMRSSPFGGSTYLPPGDGPILNLHIDVSGSVAPGTTILIDTLWVLGGKTTEGEYLWGDLVPVFEPGLLTVTCCDGRTGNIDLVGVGGLVDFLFLPPGSVTLPCVDEADVDALGGVNPVDLSDLGILVDFLFLPPGSVTLPDCP